MFDLILTILTDIVTSVRLTRVLEFASIVVVLMLFSSPGAVFSTLGIGAKAGMVDYALRPDEDKEA